MGLPDIVYLVRDGDDNEELRYSLRSLRNLPHGDVWLAGFQPSWTTNVKCVEVDQSGKKWDNQTRNLTAAVEHDGLSDPFVMFNDDFFVTEPVESVPALHRGPLSAMLRQYVDRRDQYARRIVATTKLLGPDALCYDVIHTPMTFHKEPLASVLEECRSQFLFRSVYGNRAGVGGRQIADVKARDTDVDLARPFCSTSDNLFTRKPGHLLRRQFPDPSPYEC